MDSNTIIELLKPLNASQIINTVSGLEQQGFNISQVDIPAVLSELNTTQIQGLLSSNSTVVTGLLQSLKPTQLVTIITNFQNSTSAIFQAAASTNNTTLAQAYATQGKTLVALLLQRIQTTFTDSQLLGLFSVLTNGAALGSGSKKLVSIAKNLIEGFFGGVPVTGTVEIPTRVAKLVSDYQLATFGDYPSRKDIAPSSIFMAIFFFFTLVHAWVFIKNWSLGQKFYLSLGLSFYSLIRTLGFLLRIVWSTDRAKLNVGLASTIFILIPTVILPSLNLILAQRYFTWKHPVYGSHKLFTSFMYLIYALVIGVITMTIIAAAVEVNYLLSEHHLNMTRQVLEAASILILLYNLLASAFVVLSFVIPSTKRDQSVLTYQPTWVKSFKWNYFVSKGAAQEAARSVSEEQRHAIRVIHSTSYHYDTINEASDNSESQSELTHSHSIVIIALTSLALFIGSTFRTVSTFIEQYRVHQSWIFKPVVFYVMIGVLETFINVLYILGRIDLRFYKPDAFPKQLQLKSTTTNKLDSTQSESQNDEKSSRNDEASQ